MRFDTSTKTTDLIMFNSRNLGALIVDQQPHVRSWDEPQFSIQNLAIEESYGFGVLNEGQAIAVAKNVKLRQNEMLPTARPHPLCRRRQHRLRASAGLVGGSSGSTSRRTTATSYDSVLLLSRVVAELVSAAAEPPPGGRHVQDWRGVVRDLDLALAIWVRSRAWYSQEA